MMNYDEFKDAIMKAVKSTPELENVNIVPVTVEKTNVSIDDGLRIEKKGCSVCPVIRIRPFYDMLEAKSEDDVLDEFVKSILVAFENVEDIKKKAGILKTCPKENLFVSLVNREKNTSLLEDTPHEDYLDLSLIVRCKIDEDDGGTTTVIIKKDLLDSWGMSEEELFSLAKENTRKLFSTDVWSMAEYFHFPVDLADEATMPMFFITNQTRTFGAVNGLYFTDALEELAKKLDDDVYVMPSSINEVVCVPATGFKPDELLAMVTSINGDTNCVTEDIFLADAVYLYDRKKNSISIAA